MNRPLSVAAAGIACLLIFNGCKKNPPSNVAATVNGRNISDSDLEKQLQLQFSGAGERPNDEQATIQKLEVLRSMIDGEILLQRAEKLSLMAVDADVEAKFNELKAPYTAEEFQRQLNARKMTVDELKSQLRRDLSRQKLINKEITSHIQITDKDVQDFYAANKSAFNLIEPQVHLAMILVTPQADQNVRNLKNDKAQNEEQARAKILNIDARLRQGEDFATVAQSLSEDSNTAPNGGDMGFIPESSFDTAPDLRKLVMSLQPGQISKPIRMQEGYRILKLFTREPAGQRDLNDPRVQQSIREQLINRKDQLLRNAYFEAARNEAQVTNYLATSIVQAAQKK